MVPLSVVLQNIFSIKCNSLWRLIAFSFDQECKHFPAQYFQTEIVFHFLLCKNSWDVKIALVSVKTKLLIFPTRRQFHFPHFYGCKASQTNVYFIASRFWSTWIPSYPIKTWFLFCVNKDSLPPSFSSSENPHSQGKNFLKEIVS